MRIAIREGFANLFAGAKEFCDLEGADKVAGVVQPFLTMLQIQFGQIIPGAILNIVEDLKTLKAVKNSTMWIGNINENFSGQVLTTGQL